MNYAYVWIVVALAGLGTVAGVFVFSRAIKWEWLRTLVRCLALVTLLLPAGIQVIEGYYAPAFIVVLFEGLFKQDGNPWPALQTLGAGCLLVIVLIALVQSFKLYQKRASR
jgi:hypothetical protein